MITVACCITGWLLGWILLGRSHRVPTADTVGSTAAVGGADGHLGAPARPDIVIPARDEALVIGELLADLTRTPDDVGRILVVDDHSDDATHEVAAGFAGVQVRSAPALPAGWAGKPWACHQGVLTLRSNPQPLLEVEGLVPAGSAAPLVFLDADVRLPAGAAALAPLLRTQRAHGGLVSVQPWHDTERPYEQLSALFNVLAVMGAGVSARGGPAAAFGPVLVTTFADYELAGGHEAVRGEVVEDLALARNYVRAGLHVEVFEGGPDIRFRMYPGGPRQLIEGWTKNFASGAAAARPIRLAGTVVWIAGLGSAVVALVDAARGALPWWLALGLYLAAVAQLRVAFQRVGRFGLVAAALFPVLLAFFLFVFARSLWQTHVRRRVTWRGRELPLERRTP